MSEQSLVRADLLVALENAGAVTPTELRLPDSLSLERYEAVGRMLGQLGTSVRFWAGDWLAFGEEHYGPLAAQLSEALNLSPEGRQEYLRVALVPGARPSHESHTWGIVERTASSLVSQLKEV